jgi:hypothetical protein
MTVTPARELEVRLSAPTLDFWVDVRLRAFGDRWVAAADIAGEVEIGLAASPRQALMASLAPLGSGPDRCCWRTRRCSRRVRACWTASS